MADSRGIDLPPDVLAFRPRCPGCTPQRLAEEEVRPCSYYDCPGLPASLKVTCELCMYDFSKDDGQMKCDHDTCLTAQRLRRNVAVYEAWREMVAAGG
ncbi:MAG: hypothetical protein R3246_14210 [Acidimicrobiia bacterium]|nr:hypothetical protein [Acidimicrobiia bacterium]